MAESTEWILKILSGPHQGAEVSLQPGRVLLGSDPDCDVVLHDLLIAPRHLALDLADGRLSLEPLDGPAFIAGHRARGTMPVPAFSFITAGTTHVVAGPSSSRWPLISAADAPELEKEAPPAQETTDAESASGNASQRAASPAAGAGRAVPSPEQRRRAWWSAGFGGALLLVWLTLWWTWSPAAGPAPEPDAGARAEAVLARFPDASGVRLEFDGERLTATGYVETESLHRQLASALREEVPEVTLRIWNLPRLLSAAQSVLRQRQPGIDATMTANGTLAVRGSAPSATNWSQARDLLLAEVPGLAGVDDSELVFASAPVPPPRMFPVQQPPPESSQPPAHLSVIALHSLGLGQGWLRLSDGRVFFRGGRLDAFGTVTAVDDRHALLENERGRFELRVGETLLAALDQRLPAASPDSPPAPVLARHQIPQTGENSGDSAQAD